jgi:uncharacterized protein (DUF2141 family)
MRRPIVTLIAAAVLVVPAAAALADAPCEGTLAHQIAGTEREEGPVSSQLHANEGQFGEAAPVVHQVSCLVAIVDNNLAK